MTEKEAESTLQNSEQGAEGAESEHPLPTGSDSQPSMPGDNAAGSLPVIGAAAQKAETASARPSVSGKKIAAPSRAERPSKQQLVTEEVERKRKKRRRRKLVKRIIITIIIIIVLSIVAACVSFCVWRQAASGDATDIQGTWTLTSGGKNYAATITEDKIKIADDVAYDYKLDQATKTISLEFGNLSGNAHYRFSLDRNKLAIADGELDPIGSFFSDAGWMLQAIGTQIVGPTPLSPEFSGNDDLELERR